VEGGWMKRSEIWGAFALLCYSKGRRNTISLFAKLHSICEAGVVAACVVTIGNLLYKPSLAAEIEAASSILSEKAD
jgi:hypothetical protein